nr:hypothetical protein [Providencia alcalifaciens]
MSQLSFFDVDLSQPVKTPSPIISGSPSKIDTKTDKTAEKATLTMASTKLKRDFHTEFIQLFNQTARYHSRLDVFRDFIHIAAISLENSALNWNKPILTWLRVMKELIWMRSRNY